jgi:16S rRNA (guanine966-N2)-methyltransferase
VIGFWRQNIEPYFLVDFRGHMRITAGKLKNMEVAAPKGDKTRPTSSKVREAIMSMLMPWLEGASVLDFFAGSGVFGLECLSRGSSDILFMEKDFSALNAIKKNISNAKSRIENEVINLQVKKCDIFKVSQNFSHPFDKPDIVWADPPYDLAVKWVEEYIENKVNFPCENGVLAIECSTKDAALIERLIEKEPIFSLSKIKKYGDTSIIVAERG